MNSKARWKSKDQLELQLLPQAPPLSMSAPPPDVTEWLPAAVLKHKVSLFMEAEEARLKKNKQLKENLFRSAAALRTMVLSTASEAEAARVHEIFDEMENELRHYLFVSEVKALLRK